ncbi:MAG: DUF1553 domain-containing protein [Planctomycetaceae bacterium]|nr:DUF1553 domain-containing protein [Planctomycetaceae bacterium]
MMHTDSLDSRFAPRARPGLTGLALACLIGCGSAALLADDKKNEPLDKDHAAKMAEGLALFKKSVRQTLVQNCLKCHGGESIESEFDLSDRESLLRGGAAGKAIEPGQSKSSRLIRRVTHADKPGMPFEGDPLPEAAISQIATWIDLGAPYDEPLVKEKTQSASWTQRVIALEARQFWSFQPLQRQEPPIVDDNGWCRTPIDRFIFAKLKEREIAPNPQAERWQLIRRAYFDLLGLPPSPEEVAVFLNDPSPDAWSNLLDRLLDSPHYGERWARHWLDVARFAESHGFEHDTDRPTAYHYRDAVIEALNRDLPYHTFVKWQIAGDEFAPDDNLALRCTGFLAAGVHSTQITKNEVEKHRYDELDDILGTIGQSMLGLSINCARCHDHKFDPIPQRDYYRLLSTFTTTVRSEVDLTMDREEYERGRQAFDIEHAPLVAALEKFEREKRPDRLAAWEKVAAERLARSPWIVLEPVSAKSSGGATLTRLPDGSYRAGGTNPQFDTYTFEARVGKTGITAVRLEALADAALVKGGPGRADNGNFDLTNFKVTVAKPPAGAGEQPAEAPVGDQPVRVRLKNPRASFEQPGLPIAAAIDDNEKSGWAVDPQFGKDHAATFEFETPIGFEEGTLLTLTLVFNGNDRHNFGRTRLSITTAAVPVDLAAPGVPQSILEVLATPLPERNDAQQQLLLKWFGPLDSDWKALNQAIDEHTLRAPHPRLVKAMISSEGLAAVRLNTQGGDFLEQTHFLRRGDPDQKEAVAAQGFLQVLMPPDDPLAQWQEAPPEGWRTSYRRRSLANWLTDVDRGAGGLLARVISNRLWQHHFGRGIVATPSDFGLRGTPPTHPELIDHLAAELIRSGWKLKSLHKLIMQSAAYRQSGQYDDARAERDRENQLYWRRSPHRLEAEVIRDSLLAVSGLLDRTLYGPGTLDESSRRRSIYFTIKRSKLLPMMQVFDAPDALSSIGDRSQTTVAPQALLLMNNPHTREAASAFATRIAAAGTIAEIVTAGYQTALARNPSTDELTDGIAFVETQAESYKQAGETDAQRLALTDFCQVLYCLNEFVYVE